MHWFLGFPCFEALLACFGGVRIKSEFLLVVFKGDLVCARFGAGEDGWREGEKEEESLGKMGEMHDCFGGLI